MDRFKRMNRYQKLGLYITPFIVIIIIFGIIIVKSGASLTTSTDKKNDTTYSYCTGLNYHIDNNATTLQKEQFKKLNEAIKSGEDLQIAKQVAKNFVADFFTWIDKEDTYDVGGVYYLYSPSKVNFYNQARSTFYKNLSTYKEQYGSDQLLEVKSIQVESVSESAPFEYDGKTFESFYVRLSWEYEKHDFDSSGFLNVANVQIIKNADNRFEIVEFYGDN